MDEHERLSYNDIHDENEDSYEKLYTGPCKIDPKIQKDIATLFLIKEIDMQIDSFLEIKENKLDELYENLHYTYNQSGERDDSEYHQIRSKNALKNVKRKEEISIVNEKEKLDVLMYIKKKGLIVDKLRYDEGNGQMTCLSVVICEVDEGDGEEEDPCIFIQPEFLLNKVGNIQLEEDDMVFDVYLDDIKEMVVDDIRYIFPF